MDISFENRKNFFNFRVAALIISNNNILLTKDKISNYFYLPGGRVMMNESSENALIREMNEELGFDIEILKLLWTVENFFTEEISKKKFHEIAFYYLIDIVENKKKLNDEIVFINKANSFEFIWKSLDDISNIDIRPKFLKDKILDIPNEILHIIEYE